jgi:Glycosyl hydrolase family 115
MVRVRLLTGFAFAALAGIAAAQPPAGITLAGQVTILEKPDEAGPVKKAADDLAADLETVLGKRPRIVTRDPGGAVIEIGHGSGAAESFAIKAAGNHIVLAGADMRGTIFAIYAFSQDYLGVDPMHYWNDHQPAKKAAVIIPASLNKAYPAPLFTYRGFFINDEDQLTGWAPGEKTDHSGINRVVMDKIFETILRLKGNMIVPGTWTFSSDPQMKWVGARADPEPASRHPGGHERGALAGGRHLQLHYPSRGAGAWVEECRRGL